MRHLVKKFYSAARTRIKGSAGAETAQTPEPQMRMSDESLGQRLAELRVMARAWDRSLSAEEKAEALRVGIAGARSKNDKCRELGMELLGLIRDIRGLAVIVEQMEKEPTAPGAASN
ncbi:TPA: hypothetical protein EYP38_05725 [Candidatus Micrarchaeota archaeon]|nr:hypothetical protein [Candidatus Micrarchaeota archaeon]